MADLIGARDVMRHRGPDDAGIIAWNGEERLTDPSAPATVALAHRRLSIIDLSDAGHQPMTNEDGSLWLTYNGEVYSFQEERPTLEAAGHRFSSHTDTETLLHLYEEHSPQKLLGRLNGMFAFALWDRRRQQLLLARDRAGKKPLYYSLLPDGSLVFASELKALRATGLIDESRIDRVALKQLWTLGYIVGERSIFEQVRRLLPGHYAIWSHGTLRLSEYWDCPFGVDERQNARPDELADELESILSDAVRLRLISDVPLGIFLSGGIDSSLIAALARRHQPDLTTYTIAFPQADFNEAPAAAAVARELAVRNHCMQVDESLQDRFGFIADCFDEPFGDASAIPTYFVSRLTRSQATVALSGDAGDELFAGYTAFQLGLRLFGERADRRRGPAPRSLREWIWHARLRRQPFPRGFSLMERLLGREAARELFTDALLSVTDDEVFAERERWFDRVRTADRLSQMQYLYLKSYLPDDILVKVDRTSMACSLEVRCPLLDYRVIEFASRLPRSAKIDARGRGKHLLRLLLERHLPAHLVDRPKQGFAAPFNHWCAGEAGAALAAAWSGLRSDFFRPGAASRLFPQGRLGPSRLQWNAFVTHRFFSTLCTSACSA